MVGLEVSRCAAVGVSSIVLIAGPFYAFAFVYVMLRNVLPGRVVGLDTDTAVLTAKTLSSHLITIKYSIPIEFSIATKYY